mgnify:FL=1|jgi:dihydrofolate reductase
MDVILIAAVTQDGFISRHAHETVRWSKDLRLFKEQTLGWPVIMGSHTFKSLTKELTGRDVCIVHRSDDPKKILSKYNTEKCFVIGGGKTNARFSPHLTHLYLTPHPIVFGSGIRLFSEPTEEMKLKLEKTVTVKKSEGIFQYQYRINRDIGHTG